METSEKDGKHTPKATTPNGTPLHVFTLFLTAPPHAPHVSTSAAGDLHLRQIDEAAQSGGNRLLRCQYGAD
jgi:hypothetical protein